MKLINIEGCVELNKKELTHIVGGTRLSEWWGFACETVVIAFEKLGEHMERYPITPSPLR